jgi:7-keto-8-aminopelargonate synthetase-like enzyme
MLVSNSSVSNYIYVDNKRYSFFGGNNYLGLANHPLLKKAAISSIKKYGLNFAAARQTTGTSEIHTELEKLLAGFKHKDDSVVFASGYMGNRILLSALKGQYSAVYMDEYSHSSIRDGIPSDISKVFCYNHCDTVHLESLLKKNKKQRPLIITDGIFSLTGEIAPLDKIHSLAELHDAIIVIDDAHATGVLGKNGRGTPEYFKLEAASDIYQSETMSKALGAYGGFISAGEEIINAIRGKSSIYLASTSLPPPIVSAASASIRIIRDQPELRIMLHENLKKIIEGVKNLNFHTSSERTPIIPLPFNSRQNAEKLFEFLKINGIIVPFITYPGNINSFILRITVSSLHTTDQIEDLLTLLEKWRKKHGSDKD